MRRPWFVCVPMLLAACMTESDAPQSVDTTPEAPDSDVPVEDPPDEVDKGLAGDDPGRTVLWRLHRAAYDNTTRDLFGLDLNLAATSFPPDDIGDGFDNQAAALNISPIHLETWLAASEKLAEEALLIPFEDGPAQDRFHAGRGELEASSGVSLDSWGWRLTESGSLTTTWFSPRAAPYELGASAAGVQVGSDPVRFALTVDGQEVGTFTTAVEDRNNAPRFTAVVDLEYGPVELGIVFLNPETIEGTTRTLDVAYVDVFGPARPMSNPIRDALIACNPALSDEPTSEELDGVRTCAEQNLRPFLTRAWRRPPSDDDLAAMIERVVEDVAERGGAFDDGMEHAVQVALTSPRFMFRVETVPDDTEPTWVDDWSLASRLSYFMWNSMPDETLFDLAEQGALQDPDVLSAQVQRMVADDRIEGFVEEFAGQWLPVRAARSASPDAYAYPDFDEELRASMQRETLAFFRTFLETDRSMIELLTSTSSPIDGRLARHYGIDEVTGDLFEDYPTSHVGRVGVLSHASFLAATSFPERTSPVLRGKWVLEHVLCTDPGAPPPSVEGLVEGDADAPTVRDRLEEHLTNPVCASCHEAMDPIGYALEGFDGIGASRTMDAGQPVDTHGVLPTGESFDGVAELAHVLASDPRYPACVADRLTTYALGRTIGQEERPILDAITEQFVASGYRLPALMEAIVQSRAFRMTRGGEP